ncbi:hypothetical protein MZM54_00510 [[Brevibacterium] frigoritolerans]|nr:hypothetical protein [Peribacillus frigoritolerans]
MNKFKTREPIESVHKISKDEDIEKLRTLLNELAELGWTANQWSDMLPDDDDPILLTVEPKFNDFTKEEKDIFFDVHFERIPKRYFIESFEHPKFGYIRAEGYSLVECAEKLIQRGKKQLGCSHSWAYTHSNGHKTCKLCKTFVPCTVNEALAHYEKGSVKIDEAFTLYFHNARSLCTCGSDKLHYLQHSMFDEKQYQCPVCKKYWPIKYRDSKHSSLPVSPNDDGYETASIETKKRMWDRHRFITFGVASENQIKKQINQYILRMAKHYHYIEMGQSVGTFMEWVTPYVKEAVIKTDTQIIVSGKKYTLKGITDLYINLDEKKIQYGLDIEEPEKENDDPEVVFKGVIESILSQKGKDSND